MNKTPLELLILLILIVLLTDILNVYAIRRLLLDFLIGARNRKNAYTIHEQQTAKDRITLSYIEPLLKKRKQEFLYFYKFYRVLLWFIMLQLVILIIIIGVFQTEKISRIILCISAAINFVIFIILRAQFDASWVSQYAKKK